MSTPTRWESVQAFLFLEARLLDHWRLTEWTALYADDGRYLVPPLNVADAATVSDGDHIFLIADDRPMINARAERLLKKSAYAENPRSRIRHFVSNVTILEDRGTDLLVCSCFCVYRIRRSETGLYLGEYRHRLTVRDDGYRILEKRVCLDLDRLEPQGSIGIIL